MQVAGASAKNVQTTLTASCTQTIDGFVQLSRTTPGSSALMNSVEILLKVAELIISFADECSEYGNVPRRMRPFRLIKVGPHPQFKSIN